MVFTQGRDTIPNIIEYIAETLIASSADWADADTTWTTTDDYTNLNSRRALVYSGDTSDMYVALEAVNVGISTSYIGGLTHARGLRLRFCASWDSFNHNVGSPVQQTFAPVEGRTWNNAFYEDLETQQFDYWLWVSEEGFALVIQPLYSDNDKQVSCILVMEHIPENEKEYTDGQSNWFAYMRKNYEGWQDTDKYIGYEQNKIVRPFVYDSYDGTGLQWWKRTYYSFISDGNNKIYLALPILHNSVDERTPLYRPKLFFYLNQNEGIFDNDIIAVEGETTKYLCKMIDSPDDSSVLPWAIKYSE